MSHIPLFAYATLRKGEVNHRYLDGHYDSMVPATLLDFKRIHEMMVVPSKGDNVDGELYFLRLFDYETTLARCDQLEDIPEGHLVGRDYRRKRVRVTTSQGEVEAWAYVHPSTPAY